MDQTGAAEQGAGQTPQAGLDEGSFDDADGEGGKKIAPSGAECEWVEEPSYFFKLSAYTEPLLEIRIVFIEFE